MPLSTWQNLGYFPLLFSLFLLSITNATAWWQEHSSQARCLLALQRAPFCTSYPPNKGARGGRTSPHTQQWWRCWCWSCVSPLWQKWDIKGLFTHMLVHTLEAHGAATLPGLWVGGKDKTAEEQIFSSPCTAVWGEPHGASKAEEPNIC